MAVIGTGAPDASEAERVLGAAHAVGRALARRGAVLVCGGLGGVMEAACRGAREQGGLTLGILPGADRCAANPFVQVAVPTGIGEARNTLVVRAADSVIAVAGEFGTLSEIGFALAIGKPVVGLETWELSRAGKLREAIVAASSPEEAVDRALGLAARREG